MEHPFRSNGGIFSSEDLHLLHTVCDRISLDFGFMKGELEAQDVGRAALDLYSIGVVDPAELDASLKAYLFRKAFRQLKLG